MPWALAPGKEGGLATKGESYPQVLVFCILSLLVSGTLCVLALSQNKLLFNNCH
jgi:hypothetical protein